MLYSLCRIAAGSLIAALIGIPAGIAAGIRGRRLSRPSGKGFISIASYLLYPLPKTALIPIFVLAFGIGEFSKVLLITFSLVFQIIISVRDSTAGIDESYYKSLQASGGGKTDELRYLIMPAVLPGLFSTLRISAGISVAVLFFSEYFGTTYGMGFYIMDSRVRMNYTDLYSGILVLTFISGVIFGTIRLAEGLMCRWNTRKDSGLPL